VQKRHQRHCGHGEPADIARHMRLILSGISAAAIAISALAQSASMTGRELFVAENKGNCLACHKTPTDTTLQSASNIGPPLESIKQKYPSPSDRVRLKDEIRDLSHKNPATIMPPYGKHRILTESEINAIVAYLETL
jgi:sulfur-oxidizing protein SoxX